MMYHHPLYSFGPAFAGLAFVIWAMFTQHYIYTRTLVLETEIQELRANLTALLLKQQDIVVVDTATSHNAT